ncbi:hypothetical protein OIV83_002676 [Microbotryomycetes sp. JL201]|nr:hypothetical protein OIV83_002676 [Microbotryomycetes sp. JL201]
MLASELNRLHAADDSYAPDFDDRLLIQIMMCLASGERNLVVRIGADDERLDPQERADWVKRVSAEVAWLCTRAFALTVNKIQCSSNMSSSAFMRSLFLPGPPHVRHQSSMPLSRKEVARHLSPVDQLKAYAGIDLDHPRSASSPLAATQPEPQEDPHDEVMSLRSYPSGEPLLSKPIAQDPAPFEDSQDRVSTNNVAALAGPTQIEPSRLPGARRHTVNALGTGPRSLHPPILGHPHSSSHTHTASPRSVSFEGGPNFNPSPRSASFRLQRPGATNMPTSPLNSQPVGTDNSNAIGYRRSSMTSASDSLSTGRAPRPSQPIVFPGLSTKSSWLSRQRSLDSTVEHQDQYNPRTLPHVLIVERLDKAKPSVQQSLLNILRERQFTITGGGSGAHLPRRPSYTPTLDDNVNLRMRCSSVSMANAEQWQGTYAVPAGFFCVAIVCVGSSGQGKLGNLSDYLLDRFTFSHTVSPAFLDSPRAFSAPALPPSFAHPLASLTISRRQALSSLGALPEAALPSFTSPALETYISDLLSALRHHPMLESRMLTARSRLELQRTTRIWVALSRGRVFQQVDDDRQREPKAKEQSLEEYNLLVTPKDVVSIVLSVLGHRITLRDPKKEKSLFWGSEVEAIEQRASTIGGVEAIVRQVVSVV